jgi:CubicO group peptidase (beta-lactamase class C family)
MMRGIVVLSLMATLAGCAGRLQVPSPPGEPPHEPGSALQSRVMAARDSSVAPALAAVVVSCSTIAAAADGRRALDETASVGRHDRFNIGSNSKSMLATLVAVLVESGELRWDMTAGELFGDGAASFDPALRRVTLEDLLSHRAGLDAYTSGAQIDSIPMPTGDARSQRRSFAIGVMSRPPAVAPGTETRYSNAGYVVVGAALEHRMNMPFEQLMQARLFDPLGIRATFGEPSASGGDQPRGHFSRNDVHQVYRFAEPVIPPFLQPLQPAGDVALSAEDYGKYLQLHLCGLRGRTSLLKPETIRFMHEPRGDEGASLGWGRYEFDGAPASIHVGGTGAFTAYVAVIPGRDLAVATMVNSGHSDAGRTASSLMQSLIQAPPR